MNEKILTISVSAYNVERYIEKTLQSLCINSMDKIEVLIINDGSKDNTLQIAKEYEIKYPQSFRVIDKLNGGYGTTIKKGLELATGKYFMVLDGDDWINNSELEKLVDKMSICNEDIIFWNMIYVYDDGRNRKEELFKELVPQKTYRWNDVENIFNVQIHSLAVNTEIYRNVRYTISDYFYVDIEFDVYCILGSQTFTYIDSDVYMYRYGQAEQSVSKKSMQKNYKMLEDISIRLCDLFEEEREKQDNAKNAFMLERITRLVYTTFTVALSFNPNAESKKRLYDYIKKIKAIDIVDNLMRTRIIFFISKKFPVLYPLLSSLYRKLKVK